MTLVQTAPPVSGVENTRLAEIMDVILAVAASDFGRRASIGDGHHLLDGIAAGLNMLAEEVERQRRMETEYRAGLLRAERLAAVGTLAAGVAHEINNPAAFLLGNFTALADQLAALRAANAANDPERVAAAIAEMEEIAQVGYAGVERIAHIVRGLRSFSRIEAEGVTAVRLDEVAEQACALVSVEVLQRARLVKKLERVPTLMGDRTKLTQIITNLLVNAIQAIDEGDPSNHEVELSTRVDGDRIIVRVRDTGRGIPDSARERIFDPFFTTKKNAQGTGLGLSISADIARQHGGLIRFETRPNGGSVFELDLPKDTGWLRAVPDSPPPAPEQEQRRARVLFIDDEEQLLRTYRRLFAKTHDVVIAVGGRAGIEQMLEDRTWDVIVCDLLMPEVDGAAVWEWVEANAPELVPRFIFCSGGAFTSRGAAFAEQQRDRLLEKPLSRADLEAAIRRIASASK